MTEQTEGKPSGKCPFHHGDSASASEQPAQTASTGEDRSGDGSSAHASQIQAHATTTGEPQFDHDALPEHIMGLGADDFRPASRRVGVSILKSVHWVACYRILEFFNRLLAFNPYRKFSWDKWPKFIGMLYPIAKLRYTRIDALTDSYDFATNDNQRRDNPPPEQPDHLSADGRGDEDEDNTLMGATLTRLSSDWPTRYVRPDPENIQPETKWAGKLRHRKIDPDSGREIMTPALILSLEAMAEIQFEVHDFAPQTMREPIDRCPFVIPRPPQEFWDNNQELIDRGEFDPTRVTYNGRPTRRTQVPHRWGLAVIYGADLKRLSQVRSFVGGKLKTDKRGWLPEDPNIPGVPLTGFNNNFSAWLDAWHYRWTHEHNALCDYIAYYHPGWSDDRIFWWARLGCATLMARFHTELWTSDLLQHPTMSALMYRDWNGMFGKKFKDYVMRQCQRRPWVNCLTTPLRNTELLWGMPGSPWRHYSGPAQTPVDFRTAYFLHELVPSEIEILEPGTGRLLERMKLLDFVMHNTRSVAEKYGYATIVYSLNKASCGALTLHNLALALTQFNNQQNGHQTGLDSRDLFRTREDGGSYTYNQLRIALGEPPVKSFMELTGGDQAAADELSRVYLGDVNRVDTLIGFLAGPRPEGSALEVIQYYQFVNNAPRRFCSNKFFTKYFTYKFYGEVMDWVQHRGTWLDLNVYHFPELEPETIGVQRDFAPWPEAREFPDRMKLQLDADNAQVFWTEKVTWLLAAIAAGVGLTGGAIAPWVAAATMAALSIAPLALALKRMLALQYMHIAWQKSTTDKAPFYFGTLYKGRRWINRAKFFGNKVALLTFICGGTLAGLAACGGHWWVTVLYAITALSGLRTMKANRQFAHDAHLQMILLRNLMRQACKLTDPADLPGDCDMAKAYWFLHSEKGAKVATIGSIFRKLRESGEPFFKSLGTAVLSGIGFAHKSKKGASRKELREAGIGLFGLFKIYIPGLPQLVSDAPYSWYASVNNPDGIKPGDINMKAVHKAFMDFAPGRHWMEAWDLRRKREKEHWEDARYGVGNFITRWYNRLSMKRRHKQLIELYANTVKVSDNRQFVPAITRDELIRVLNGAARVDLWREGVIGDCDPSPKLWLKQ